MRYEKNESTYILAPFDSGDTVTIDIYRLSDDVKIVDGASCSEVGSTGIFKYLFSQTITAKEEYLWIMTNGSYTRQGKIVLGGWMDDVKEKVDTNLDTTVSSRASATQLSTHDSDIKAVLADIEGSGFDTSTDSLKKIRDKIDEIDTSTGNIENELKKHDSKMTAFKFI